MNKERVIKGLLEAKKEWERQELTFLTDEYKMYARGVIYGYERALAWLELLIEETPPNA